MSSMADLCSHQYLHNAAKSPYQTGRDSDFIITCGKDVHRVHKAVICSRSLYFEAASKFGRERAESAIHLHEDDPEIVRYMVNYFYESRYIVKVPKDENPLRLIVTYRSNPIDKRRARRLVEGVASMRSDYTDRIVDVVKEVTHAIELEVTGLANIRLNGANPTDYMQTKMHEIISTAQADPTHSFSPNRYASDRALILHAKVYALADKYAALGLKEHAKTEFEKCYADPLTSDAFDEAVSVVFSSTHDEDRGLRDVVTRHYLDAVEVFGVFPRLRDKLEEIPELGARMLGMQFGDTVEECQS